MENIRDHCYTGHFLKLKILNSQTPKVEDNLDHFSLCYRLEIILHSIGTYMYVYLSVHRVGTKVSQNGRCHYYVENVLFPPIVGLKPLNEFGLLTNECSWQFEKHWSRTTALIHEFEILFFIDILYTRMSKPVLLPKVIT